MQVKSELSLPQSAASEASNFQDNTKLAKLDNLKRKITWICCSDLLDPPLPYVGAVTYEKGDTEEDKRLKREDQARKLREKEEERIRREPELVEKFEKVIERVRKARSEYPKPEVDYLQNSIARTVTNFRCKICNNKDQDAFEFDHTTGDTACTNCGNIVEEHHVYLGQAKRNLGRDGTTEDKGHHGPAPNQMMPDSWNMRTSIRTNKPGSLSSDSNFRRLAWIHDQLEMNLSTIGMENDVRRTRLGYKNQQKTRAFEMIDDLVLKLNLHKAVIKRAREEFSNYRDVRETIQDFEAVVAACVIMAYQELSADRDVDAQGTKMYADRKLDIAGPTTTIATMPRPPPVACVPVSSGDKPTATLHEIKMGQWNEDQTQQWLEAVAEQEFISAVPPIMTHIRKMLSEDINGGNNGGASGTNGRVGGPSYSILGKRKPDLKLPAPMIFGTTTMEGRMKLLKAKADAMNKSTAGNGVKAESSGGVIIKQEPGAASSSSSSSISSGSGGNNGLGASVNGGTEERKLTAGQCLGRVKFHLLFPGEENKKTVTHFNECVRVRLRAEVLQREAIEAYEKELRRRRIEEKSEVRTLRTVAVTEPQPPQSGAAVKVEGNGIGIKSEPPIKIEAAPSTSSSSSAAAAAVAGQGMDDFDSFFGAPVDLTEYQVATGAGTGGVSGGAGAGKGAGAAGGLTGSDGEKVGDATAAGARQSTKGPKLPKFVVKKA